MPERVVAYVDGFDLYHAIDALQQPHLKWVNIWELCDVFVRSRTQKLTKVYYFSAFADWLPDAHRRHKAYVNALITTGVTPAMAKFKEKHLECCLLPEGVYDAGGNIAAHRPDT